MKRVLQVIRKEYSIPFYRKCNSRKKKKTKKKTKKKNKKKKKKKKVGMYYL
jgi:hypothetical protein